MTQTKNHYSKQFKHQVLEDYFQSGISSTECAKKWKVPQPTIYFWLQTCKNDRKSVSLYSKKIHMDAKDQALENLRVENERLRREVEYQKLKTAGYERLLEIIKEEDGIDLLKKDGAKQ